MDKQFISYHYHGDQVHPEGLQSRFTSYEHLGSLINKFTNTRPCNAIKNRALLEVALASRVKYNTNKYGDLVSPHCSLVADKGHHCVKCRNFIRSLMKKKIVLDKNPKKWKEFDKRMKHRKLESCRRKVHVLERKAKVKWALLICITESNSVKSLFYHLSYAGHFNFAQGSTSRLSTTNGRGQEEFSGAQTATSVTNGNISYNP